MRSISVFISFLLVGFACSAQVAPPVMLPNGWSLTPAGTSISLGDLPLNMAISPTGKYVAVTNNGVSDQSIQLIDAKEHKLLSTTPIAKSWLGLKFSQDGKYLYASGGNDNRINRYEVAQDSLILTDSIVLGKKWPVKISPAGLDVDDAHKRLYVVTKENSSLYIAELSGTKAIKQIQLSAEGYTCLLSKDTRKLYISLWGGDKVLIFDTKREVITDSIMVGANPTDMCMTTNGKFLFVANALDNSVSVISLKTSTVIETLNAALFPNAPIGSTTNSVALDNEDKTLYIANADNNCLAVFDVSNPGSSFSKGFIPVGWYPTCVRVSGNTIYATNGKGLSSAANPKGPQPVKAKEQTIYKKANKRNDQYIGSLFKGALSFINIPTEKELAVYSQQVYKNTPYTKGKELSTEGQAGNAIPSKVGDPSPIKHVFYVIKENRTYDQVLGDMPAGNGDTSLVLFGKNITPNEHALATQFVLLDNFYVDAEVSADGHNWSDAAYANDYIEKTWPTNYGGRGGNYDYEGSRKLTLPKNGFLWDYALRNNVTVRNYGEFVNEKGETALADLTKHTCHAYPMWNLSLPDTIRERIWEHDFDSLLALNQVPGLNIVYLPNDHTSGMAKNAKTPFALVGDNDLALGRLVEHLSHSNVWKETAIFVLEDDAQNGPDHVDAHRSIAFVAGPYVKRNFVDHTFYSTSAMLRTMELILGLPPMSQYDAGATPMWRSFAGTADTTAYTHLDALVNLAEKNVAVNELSKQSASFSFNKPDETPDLPLNKVLWEAIKGKTRPFPAPQRAAFVNLHTGKEKDND